MPRQKSKVESAVITPQKAEQLGEDQSTQEQDSEEVTDTRFTRDQIIEFLKKKSPFTEPGDLSEAFNQIGRDAITIAFSGPVALPGQLSVHATVGFTADPCFYVEGIGAAVLAGSAQEAIVRAQGNAIRNALSVGLSIPVTYLPDPEVELVMPIHAVPAAPQPVAQAQPQMPQGTTTQRQAPVVDIPAETGALVCADCGGEIVAASSRDGSKFFSVKQVLDMGMKESGGIPVCWGCKNKRWGKRQPPRQGGYQR